jgi:hypothetical protein
LRKLLKVHSASSHYFSSTLIPCCVSLLDFLSSFIAADLATANARIASLEAELSASQKAYDVAAAAKASAEKSQRSTLGKAKKAEKALADANKEHAQREQAVTERLRTMSASAKSKCFVLSFILTPIVLFILADTFLSLFSFVLLCCAGFTGVSSSSLQPDDDPLLTTVNLLEANWISIQETFELVSRILSRQFVGLWPKKKAEVPKDNLDKLAKAFDTTEDPTLQLKGLSLKRGAEGAIALSFAHGADFDWEKVSSPHDRTRDEMKAFFEKAKKLAPALAAIISPSAASTASTAPAPATEELAPPSTFDEGFVMPSSSTEQNAEVA